MTGVQTCALPISIAYLKGLSSDIFNLSDLISIDGIIGLTDNLSLSDLISGIIVKIPDGVAITFSSSAPSIIFSSSAPSITCS